MLHEERHLHSKGLNKVTMGEIHPRNSLNVHTAEYRYKFHKFKEAISLVAQIERDEAEFRVVKQHNQCACLEFFLQFVKLRAESITHLRENTKRVRLGGEILLREIDLHVAGKLSNYLIPFNPFQYLVVIGAGFDVRRKTKSFLKLTDFLFIFSNACIRRIAADHELYHITSITWDGFFPPPGHQCRYTFP
jgi:hypothetical protein